MDSTQRVRAILSFIHVADSGSFAAAARSIGISAAAVSKNVSGLERALGVRLINRTTRSMTLTSEGTDFLSQARVGLQALDTAVEQIVTRRAGPSGRVRISSSVAFARDQLMPALPGLLARYPNLTVEVDFDDQIIDLIRDGYDLGLRGGHITDSVLISRRICRLNMALVAAPSYLARVGTPRRPEDLSQHQLISRRFLRGGVSKWRFRMPDGGIVALEPHAPSMTISSPEALVQASLMGMGIAQAGVHHAWPYLRSGELVIVLNEWHHPGDYEMVMQYPHRSLLAPRVRVVIEHLLDVFSKDAALHVPLSELKSYAV